MSNRYRKLVEEFYSLNHQLNQYHPKIELYLKQKGSQVSQITQQKFIDIDWKQQLIEVYGKLKQSECVNLKITVICEQLISQTDKLIKAKQLQIQLLNTQLHMTKSQLEQEKLQVNKLQKDHESVLKQQRQQLSLSLQKLHDKDMYLRELQEKIIEYEQEIEQIKSHEYQNMLQSIKEEQILNSQAQLLYKENTLMKNQLKEENLLKIHMNKQIKMLNEELDMWKHKYEMSKIFINNKFNQKHTHLKQPLTSRQNSNRNKKLSETPINLIEFKDDFSFKDSIQNDNDSFLYQTHLPSFLYQDSHSEKFYPSQQSPSCLIERDILNLTDRQISTRSKNDQHLLRSKKYPQADKQNISQNTCDLQDFDYYHYQNKISNFGSKKNHHIQKQLQTHTQKQIITKIYQQTFSNTQKLVRQKGSLQKFVPSQKNFESQQRSSLLSKHRRIKSSFCTKSIHEFQQYQSNNLIANFSKFTESMIDQVNTKKNDGISEEEYHERNIQEESQLMSYNVNEIVINQELLSSHKPKIIQDIADARNSTFADVKMVNSVQVTPKMIQKQRERSTPSPTDPYYAFFSLTAQCVKLNSKNFNQAISVYFNLQQEYNHVIKNMIPINKWYNYIDDQIKTSLKYIM